MNEFNFLAPDAQPIETATRSRGPTETGNYKKGVTYYDNAADKWYVTVGKKKYPMTSDSLKCAGHANVWSTYLDKTGRNIRIVRAGSDRHYSLNGFLPFKEGHTVCGRLVRGFVGISFDVIVNSTALEHDHEGIKSAYQSQMRLRAINKAEYAHYQELEDEVNTESAAESAAS